MLVSLAISARSLLVLPFRLFLRDDEWYLQDGVADRRSTNGTWYSFTLSPRLYLSDFYPLAPNMQIKAGQTLFLVRVSQGA